MLVGIALGTLGSGGSILTVPIMVYLMNIKAVDATGYSLFVVGLTSTFGGVNYIRKKLVDINRAILFAVPSIISVFLTRVFIVPFIPNTIATFSGSTLTKDLFIILIFAVLMIVVAFKMIQSKEDKELESFIPAKSHFSSLIATGLFAGIFTGILGVGGGFIIIPALVLFAKTPVKMSVGTSLLIIATNSFMGFIGEVIAKGSSIDYSFLLVFSVFSISGIFIGSYLLSKISSFMLKKIFGWFVLFIGISILLKEIFFQK